MTKQISQKGFHYTILNTYNEANTYTIYNIIIAGETCDDSIEQRGLENVLLGDRPTETSDGVDIGLDSLINVCESDEILGSAANVNSEEQRGLDDLSESNKVELVDGIPCTTDEGSVIISREIFMKSQ